MNKGLKKVERNIHTIDAENQPLGRLAVQVAVFLRGKHKPTFVPYMDMGDTVIVKNVDKMKFTGNKLENKNYFRFTGYLGNMKTTTLKEYIIKRGGKEVLRTAVMGMLAKNTLRDRQIKRLKFDK